jgi:hypothetical protein
MTYKYENENANLDKNLHQFFFSSLSWHITIIKPRIFVGGCGIAIINAHNNF